MTRNLSLIPTIEAEEEAAPPAPHAAPIRAAPPRAAPASPRALTILLEVLAYAVIVLLFVDVAWPLYVWIGK